MTGVALASLSSMPPPVVVEYLLVGGGGGGGISFRAAGGGGGGGEGQNANAIVAPGDTWTITVGAGGTAWNYYCGCPLNAPVYALPSDGGASCIAPLNIVALGGNYGAGNCLYALNSAIWAGKQPSVPPFGGGVGGGGSICVSPPGNSSNRFPGRTTGIAGSGGAGCGANNNLPLYPTSSITPVFGTGAAPLGGCWRVGGGGGGGSIPPALGNSGTTGIFTGGTPPLTGFACSNLMVCAGAGGNGFTIPWAGTFGGGGGGAVRNNVRTGCSGGTPPLFRCWDNRICDGSGPGGTGGGGLGPRENFGPASCGYGMVQAIAPITIPGGENAARFGQTNTGGGAGGSGSTCASPPNAAMQDMQVGAFGGSGVAFVRYPANFRLAVTTGNPTVTIENGYIVYKFTGSGTIQF